MARGVWVYLEQEDGSLESVSLELAGRGRSLAQASGEPLIGLLVGEGMMDLAGEASRYGLDEVWVVDHPLLGRYTTDAYVQAVHGAIARGKPDIFLLGATPNGRDLAGRLAVRLRTGLTADCTHLDVQASENGPLLLSEVTGFGGGIAAIIACKVRRPQMATVRPGVFPIPPRGAPSAEKTLRRLDVPLDPQNVRTRVLERKKEEGVDLTQDKHLVVGGRGVR